MSQHARAIPPTAPPPVAVAPERLAEILDIAEDGIITVNLRRQIVLFNRGASKIFGYPPEEVLGRPLEDLLPPAYRAAHPAQVESFAEGPVVSRIMGERRVVAGRRKDGAEFPAEVTISKLERGGETLLTAIVRDATVRMKYEDALVKLNQDLEERVRVRTAELAERNLQLAQKNEENEMFVYSVSHDLRSPLVNLEGFSDELRTSLRDLDKLLRDGQIPAAVRERAADVVDGGMRESIDFIRTAVSRLSRIIDALLRLSRAGRVTYQRQVLDVDLIVRRVVDALHGTVAEKRAEVVVGRLPPALGDQTAVEQVFANLIGNALNYLDPARPGRVVVGSRIGRSGPDGDTDATGGTYFVRDNGLGIPPAYLPKLFQAFQRLHPDKAPGEGIGLAIVRRILERLGGTIWAESLPSEGTTMYFTLPAPAHPVTKGSTP
jgi:PAS domain S-box-containing protein